MVPLACGLDLGGTKLLGVVVATDGAGQVPPQVLLEDRVPTPQAGPEALIETAGAMVGRLRDRAAAELGAELTTVGFGAPGLVDRSGVLRFGPHLPGIVDVPVDALLAEATGLFVAADNDATCAAWAEHERGAARGHDDVVMITLGTGIGAGIIVGGEVLRGAHGFAGEPGHMVVDPNGPRCPCGRRGCWERYASGEGLGRLGRELAVAGQAPGLAARAGGHPEGVRGEHVTAAALAGDPAAMRVLREFAWWLALGIANLVTLLDVELVVVGGGLIEAADAVMAPIRDAFSELVMAGQCRADVEVVAAELGERAGAVGAALLGALRSL